MRARAFRGWVLCGVLVAGLGMSPGPARAQSLFTLTLESPRYAFLNGAVPLRGYLRLQGRGLIGQRVELLSGEQPIVETSTDQNGLYDTVISFPETGSYPIVAVAYRGTPLEVRSPSVTVTVVRASSVAGGRFHTCAIVEAGEVLCWGRNNHGQLGDGSAIDRVGPNRVSGISDAIVLAAGEGHTCAIRSGGEVLCWGANDSGQIGDGSARDRLTPVVVSGLASATAIAAGSSHTCVVHAGGDARCWGGNGWGQLGDGTKTLRTTPVAVSSLTGATAISAGYSHTCALLSSGGVRCWGAGVAVGDGSSTERLTPVDVSGITDATAIAAGGGSFACARLASGEVRCWGSNWFFGALGDGTTTDRSTPVSVVGITDAIAIDAGDFHACATLSGGEARCWGHNGYGQLLDGTMSINRLTPVPVVGFSEGDVISTGGYHTCLLRSAGPVQCGGYNVYGQLGHR